MRSLLLLFLLSLSLDAQVAIQGPRVIPNGTSDPSTCTAGQLFIRTDTGAIKACISSNTWVAAAGGSGVVVMTSGTTDPVASCSAPSSLNLALFAQTTTKELWMCIATNTWKRFLSTSNVGPFADSGTAGPFASGVAASRGTCTTNGYYLATDTHALTVCDGTTWSSTLNPSGSYALIFNSSAGAVQVYDSAGSNILTSGGGGGGTGTTSYTVSFDGLGTALSGGATRCIPMPVTGPLTAVRLQACNGYDGSTVCNAGGTATVDIKTVTNSGYASTGPSAASSIHGSGSLLSISSAYAANGVLTGWTTSSFGGQTACVVLTSPTAISVDVVMVVN